MPRRVAAKTRPRQLGLAPDYVVIDGVARGADRLQRGVAQPLAVIDLVRVRSLEQQPAHVGVGGATPVTVTFVRLSALS
jgi:hypothetical protein